MSTMRLGEEGFAFVATLGLMAMVVVLGLAGLVTSQVERRGAHNFVTSGQAFWAAEAGLETALVSWDQPNLDANLTQTGDSLVGAWIDWPNECSSRTTIRRIDGGTGRELYEVSTVGQSRGGIRTVAMLVRSPVVMMGNAITVGGSLEISGQTTLSGDCANIHVNGALLDVGATMETEGEISGSGAVTGDEFMEDPHGDPVTPEENAPQQPIPAMLPSAYCDQADFVFSGGIITNVATSQTRNINGSEQWGWEYSSGKYVMKSTVAVATGTLCFDNDVEVSVDLGTAASPRPMSFITTESITLPGNSFLEPDHPSDILLLALGDVKLNGNSSPGSPNVQGTIYSNSQCELSGQLVIEGRLICRDNPNPAGSENWASENKISGQTDFTYTCPDDLEWLTVSPISERPWLQVIR